MRRFLSAAAWALIAGAPVLAAPASAQGTPDSTVSARTPAGVTVKDLAIGRPVFGTDGIRIGEINRIKADASGRVTEVQVTTGGPAGLTAEVVSIAPDQITNGAPGTPLKLSLSAEDARKLPVLSEGDKG